MDVNKTQDNRIQSLKKLSDMGAYEGGACGV